MHALYKPRPKRVKDYIAVPKPNGYQSLHTSMIGPHGVPVEVQIRTEDMDKMADMGVTAHWRYKEGESHHNTTVQLKAQQWLQSIVELQTVPAIQQNLLIALNRICSLTIFSSLPRKGVLLNCRRMLPLLTLPMRCIQAWGSLCRCDG